KRRRRAPTREGRRGGGREERWERGGQGGGGGGVSPPPPETAGGGHAPPLAHGGPPLAVIPTLGIGGPLAILALLFPSLFGGVLVLFRRWLAFFTVLSTICTLYLIHAWLRGYYWGDWWTKPIALWTTCLAITALGALWSWQRHLTAMATAPDTLEPPRRTELIVLSVLTFSCVALVVLYLFFDKPTVYGSWWDLLV